MSILLCSCGDMSKIGCRLLHDLKNQVALLDIVIVRFNLVLMFLNDINSKPMFMGAATIFVFFQQSLPLLREAIQ